MFPRGRHATPRSEFGYRGGLDRRDSGRREQGRLSVLERRESQPRSLVKLAAAAEVGDPKVAVLIAQIHAIRGASPRANILIYTEYTASLAVLAAALGGACTRGELTGQILTISGEDPDERRSELTSRFRSEDDVILVSTDASAEGLNLHDRCHHLLHLELPYNPNRIEQRNGRIDRFGQRHDPQIYYLFLAGTFEEHLLMRLVSKYEAQRRALGCVPDTLGFTVDSTEGFDTSILRSFADEETSPLYAAQASGQVRPTEHDDLPAFKEILSQFDSVFAEFMNVYLNYFNDFLFACMKVISTSFDL